MSNRQYIAICGMWLLIGFGLGYATARSTEPAKARAAFDYSQCQYPDRTTNPPGGCDNSDPCDPANVKGGSGDCVDVAVPKVNEPAPTVDVEPTPAPVTNNNCGGK